MNGLQKTSYYSVRTCTMETSCWIGGGSKSIGDPITVTRMGVGDCTTYFSTFEREIKINKCVGIEASATALSRMLLRSQNMTLWGRFNTIFWLLY